VYGPGAAPRTILASRELSAPTAAAPFLQALGSASPTTAAAPNAVTDRRAASTPATPRTTTAPVADDDVRARAVDIQQTLDRLLAETTPAPVATTGTTTDEARRDGTVTIDRAQLLQLRQQLDALIAALSRR